jgi:DNA polymerase-3 subunit delta'
MTETGVPEQFDSLPGVPDPSETPATYGHAEQGRFLARAYRSGKMPQGLLFGGPRGIGKATLAFQFLRYLLTHPNPETAPETIDPADVSSPIFRRIANRSHAGLLYLARPWDEKGKKFKTAITVEEIRSIAHFVGLTAHDGGYRTVIIDSADDMNRSAANALLKNLEEPPARTIFILISHTPGRLLPTIRSRCQYVRFAALTQNQVAKALDALPEPMDARFRDEAVSRSGGSVREAILLAQFGGLEIGTAVRDFLRSDRFNVNMANQISGAVSTKGNDVQFDLFNTAVLDFLSASARDAAVSGNTLLSARLSRIWDETSRRTIEATTYNLDRKQHVLSVLANLNMTVPEET